MFSSVFARSKTNFLADSLLNGAEHTGQAMTRTDLEARLARKGLMIGLSMQQNTVVIHLVGKLNNAGSPIFKELLKTFLSNGYSSFVFDLSGLESLDGAGVAALVWTRNQMLEKGGRASVTNPTKEICSKLLALNFQHLVEIESINYLVSAN